MHHQLERCTAETLLPLAGQVGVRRQQVRRVDVHRHDFHGLLHVTGGRAEHRVNGVVHELRGGVRPPGDAGRNGMTYVTRSP